jgi:hypothetical protein
MSKFGGSRPGAGRPKGATTRRTQEIAAKEFEKVTPLEVMLANMRFAHERAEEVAKVVAGGSADPDTLKELLRLRQMAQDCAKDAAPYMHPRLNAVATLDPDEAIDGGKLTPAPQNPGEDHLDHITRRYRNALKLINASEEPPSAGEDTDGKNPTASRNSTARETEK